MFYFWNVDQLVKDLRADIVTEVEKMRYLLATSFLQLFAFQQASTFTPVNPYEMLIKPLFFGVQVGILVWGFQHCFYINQKNDNKNFIERFICLGFPVGIRLGVYLLLGTIFVLIVGLLVSIHYYPVVLQAIRDFTNAENITVVKSSTETIIKTSPALKAGILRMHIFQYIVSYLFSIIFFIILGKKIDAVGKVD